MLLISVAIHVTVYVSGFNRGCKRKEVVRYGLGVLLCLRGADGGWALN